MGTARRVQSGNAPLPDHDPTEVAPSVFGMPNTQARLYEVDPTTEVAQECAALAESSGDRGSEGPRRAIRGDDAENGSVRHAEHRPTRTDTNSGGVLRSPRTQAKTVAL